MERERARAELATVALARLEGEDGLEAHQLRGVYRQVRAVHADPGQGGLLNRRHGLSLAVVLAQRTRLDELRDADEIGADAYLELQEDLDWKQLATAADEDRRIEEA